MRETLTETRDDEAREPTLDELAAALSASVGADGALPGGVGERLALEHRWWGRTVEVLAILTEDPERLGYLVGGTRPDEVIAWLPSWVATPLTLEEIREVVLAGGWDPEPFVTIAAHGLLDALLRRPDGSLRRVRGERAGAWLSDRFALAESEDEVVAAVRELLAEDGA